MFNGTPLSALFGAPGTRKSTELLRKLELMKRNWCQEAHVAQPGYSAIHVRMICDEIVKRAEILSRQSDLDLEGVAKFLLERSLSWLHQKTPMHQIGHKLPKTLKDLGMLKLAEGGPLGGPLTDYELSAVKRGKK